MRAHYLHRAVQADPLTAFQEPLGPELYGAVIIGVQKDQDCVTFRLVLRVLKEILQLAFQLLPPVGIHHPAFSLSHNNVRPVEPFTENTAQQLRQRGDISRAFHHRHNGRHCVYSPAPTGWRPSML